jgi:hypothetical protein
MDLCGNCQYFVQPGVHQTAYGQCVRFPKTEDKHVGETCGEFKAREPIKLKEPAKSTKGT